MNRIELSTPRKILAVAVGLALCGAVAAQTAGSPAPGGTAPGARSPAGAPAAATPARSPAAEATHELKAVRLSKLDGVNIYDSESKKIGEVKDVVLDSTSGQVQHAVVSIGGVMGVGDKEHAVPLKDLKVYSRAADDSVPAKVTLASGPDNLPAAKKLEKDSPHVLGSKLIGTDVSDAEGKDAGEIEDLVVDLQSGQVQYALMEFDKAWSMDDKLVAFKMSEFQRDKDGKDLVLKVTKESVAQKPSLEKSRLDKTDLSDASWLQKVGSDTAGAQGGSTTAGSTGAGSSGGSTPAAGTGSAGSTPAAGSDAGGSKPAGSPGAASSGATSSGGSSTAK